MALSFASLLPQLAAGANVASGAAGLMGLFSGNKPGAAERQMMQRQSNIDELTRALEDPNHPYNKYLVEQESQLARGDMQTYLRDLMNANRRAALLGRQTAFDPERRDEAFNQYVTRGSQKIAPTARLNANNRIMQSIKNLNGSMGGLNNLATLQGNRSSQRRKDMAAGFSGINKILQAVGGQQDAGQANTTGGIPKPWEPAGQSSQWNIPVYYG